MGITEIFALAGSASAVYLSMGAYLAHRFTSVPRGEPGDGPEGRLPAHEAVRLCSRDGLSLAAWYVPASEPVGAVVFVHGRGAHKGFELEADPLALVDSLVRSGLSVLAIDLRGHGHSAGARLTYGLHERNDVLGALDWLRARGYRHGRIGVLGASMGGAAAIAAAAEDDGIGAVISDSAFADFGIVLSRRFPRVLPLRSGRLFLRATVAVAKLMTGVRLDRFRPVDHARAVAGRPFLVIHSAGDRFIEVDHAHALAQAGQAELWVDENKRHVGTFEAQTGQYIERVVGFMTNALQREPLAPHVDAVTARATTRAANAHPTPDGHKAAGSCDPLAA